MRTILRRLGWLAIVGLAAVPMARQAAAQGNASNSFVMSDLAANPFDANFKTTSFLWPGLGASPNNYYYCSCDCDAGCDSLVDSDCATGCDCTTGCDQATCGAGTGSGDPIWRIWPQDRPIRVRGWLDAGILGNTSNPGSHFNGPYNSQEVDNGQFNQAYLIVDKLLASDGSRSWGGRFDLLYGADYYVAQSRGLEVNRDGSPKWNSSQYYGLALPQAYLEVGTTTRSVKFGHFYTLVGYEGVQAANNFFYSHAYSYQFAGPFTQWGGIGVWNPSDNWAIQGGLVNGWNALSEQVNHVSFLGNIRYTSDSKQWWTSFAIITGDEYNNPAALPTIATAYTNRTRYSFIINRQLGSRFEYVFHQWLGAQQQGAADGSTAMWYGIDQYLYFRLNSKWRLGTRVEWFRDEDGTRVGLTEPSNPNKAPLPGSYCSWTVGANWTPLQNLTVRPELRWDTYRGTAKPFDDGTKTYQLLLGCDAILQY